MHLLYEQLIFIKTSTGYLQLFSNKTKIVRNAKKYNYNRKVFILPRVAELFIYEEKKRGFPLLGANKYFFLFRYISNQNYNISKKILRAIDMSVIIQRRKEV